MDDQTGGRLARGRGRSPGRRGVPRARGDRVGMSAYTPHTPDDVAAMLDVIGAPSLDALIAHVPASLRERARIDLAPGLTEPDLRRAMEGLAQRNAPVPDTAV